MSLNGYLRHCREQHQHLKRIGFIRTCVALGKGPCVDPHQTHIPWRPDSVLDGPVDLLVLPRTVDFGVVAGNASFRTKGLPPPSHRYRIRAYCTFLAFSSIYGRLGCSEHSLTKGRGVDIRYMHGPSCWNAVPGGEANPILVTGR
jgi:hypothetical protein